MFKVNKQCSTIDLNPLADVKTAEAALRVPAARHVGSCSLSGVSWRAKAYKYSRHGPYRVLRVPIQTQLNPHLYETYALSVCYVGRSLGYHAHSSFFTTPLSDAIQRPTSGFLIPDTGHRTPLSSSIRCAVSGLPPGTLAKGGDLIPLSSPKLELVARSIAHGVEVAPGAVQPGQCGP